MPGANVLKVTISRILRHAISADKAHEGKTRHLLEYAGNNGIIDLTDSKLVFENQSTNKIKMTHIKIMLCGSFIGIDKLERLKLEQSDPLINQFDISIKEPETPADDAGVQSVLAVQDRLAEDCGIPAASQDILLEVHFSDREDHHNSKERGAEAPGNVSIPGNLCKKQVLTKCPLYIALPVITK